MTQISKHYQMNEIKSKIPDVFAVTPALLPQTGVPGSQLL